MMNEFTPVSAVKYLEVLARRLKARASQLDSSWDDYSRTQAATLFKAVEEIEETLRELGVPR
jgi:methionyl-tRNA synthetase